MKIAGWLSIAVAAMLFFLVVTGMQDDVHAAMSPEGRDLTRVDSLNTQWLIEGIGGAMFLVAGVAMVARGSKQSV